MFVLAKIINSANYCCNHGFGRVCRAKIKDSCTCIILYACIILDRNKKMNLVINYLAFCFTHARTDWLKTKEAGDVQETNIMVCRMPTNDNCCDDREVRCDG